jgi:hypothetical protein
MGENEKIKYELERYNRRMDEKGWLSFASLSPETKKVLYELIRLDDEAEKAREDRTPSYRPTSGPCQHSHSGGSYIEY